MKKLVVFLMLALTVGLAKAELPLALGLKFGYLNSKYTLKGSTSDGRYTIDDFNADTENGYQLGAMARLKFGEKFFLQPELYYTGKKGSGTFTNGVDGLDYQQKMNFYNMDIPILLNYKLIDLKLAQINIFAGPSASFVMKETLKLKATGDSDWDKIDPTNSDLKTAQWNGQVGVGVDFLMLTLDARYEFGLNDISGAFSSNSSFLTFSLAWRIFG